MSSPQEYHYTAEPTMSQCQGQSCYCFYGKNQMEDFFSDSESETDSVLDTQGWRIDKKEEWTVVLNEIKFRHPRVLLAYFRFIALHNEMAEPEEKIFVPVIPKKVSEFILSHTSFEETPEEFKSEVSALRSFVSFFSRC